MSSSRFFIIPLLVVGGAVLVLGCADKAPQPTNPPQKVQAQPITCPPDTVIVNIVNGKVVGKGTYSSNSVCGTPGTVTYTTLSKPDTPGVYDPALIALLKKYGPVTFVRSMSDSAVMH